MIAKDFIKSGKLQDYCLGLLSVKDNLQVEKMCAQYPEVDGELKFLQESLKKYTSTNIDWHKEIIRSRIWAAIKRDVEK
ncbi:hypothetical protein BH10BAC3_BH10BAC3_35890 [soil metagenome]